MGFLTTITICNDGIHNLTENPEELADKLYNACIGAYVDNQVGLGNHCNMLILQKPRHTCSTTLYLHHGGGVIDTTEIKKDHASLDAAINILKDELRRLKNIKKGGKI